MPPRGALLSRSSCFRLCLIAHLIARALCLCTASVWRARSLAARLGPELTGTLRCGMAGRYKRFPLGYKRDKASAVGACTIEIPVRGLERSKRAIEHRATSIARTSR